MQVTMFSAVCLRLLSRQHLSSPPPADGNARAALQTQVHSVLPAALRSLRHGPAHAVSQTQASSVLTAARARKGTLPLFPLLQAGRANAAQPTQASSVLNAASQNLQLPRSTSATSAAGHLPIPNILRSSVPNAATPSTRTIWYNKHNKQAFTLPYGRVLCGLIPIMSVEQ